jgi:eukaryotic-like serine/threonine-protein kinase
MKDPDRPSDMGAVTVAPTPLDDGRFESRYVAGEVLGQGGMGEVRSCLDARIGRRVAVKVVRRGTGSAADARARFVREARVQGQLEHPAVVPVYDFGITPDGLEYFTMKRVRGQTLADVIEELRTRAEPASNRRLLSAFSRICLAVDYAHTRGVLHRDLKPANLMVGDFGEVYVLDWGLAKVRGAPDLASADAVLDAPGGELTLDGSILGTPGYVAPERIAGEEPDARADVYSLGAILYEILALEPLVPRGNVAEMLAWTLSGRTTRATRPPERDVPPELEELCVRATAADPADRIAGARELAEGIERFLDGERDLELRRQLAARHGEAARRSAEAALADGEDALGHRRQALREVGRALALAPDDRVAAETLSRLLTEPPAEIPAEVERRGAQSEHAAMRSSSRIAAIAYGLFVLALPFLALMGVRNWLALAPALTLTVAATATAWHIGRIEAPTTFHALLLLSLGTALMASLSVVFGPYFVVPAIVAVHTMAFGAWAGTAPRAIGVSISCLAILAPAVLEWTGLAPASVRYGETLSIVPRVTAFPAPATEVFLLFANLLTIAFAGWVATRLHGELRVLERRLHVQTWQLEQLVAGEART